MQYLCVLPNWRVGLFLIPDSLTVLTMVLYIASVDYILGFYLLLFLFHRGLLQRGFYS